MGDPAVEARWATLRDAIMRDVGDGDVTVRIPRWLPTSLDEGLRWTQGMVYEGWYVRHLVDESTSPQTLWFKIWEFGDDEPTWDEVKATPSDPPRPELDFW